MPVRNPRLPEYPRPVSPISADEIPICDDTIVYRDQTDEAAESSEQRAAKRRRIESHSTAYLRGQPLFIPTAQLKGPFDGRWKNPWAKRTMTQAEETVISQHGIRPASKLVQGKKEDFIIPKAERVSRTAAETSMGATKKTQDNPAEPNLISLRRSEQRKNNMDPHPWKKDDLVSEDHKVRDWLRTNSVYQRPGDSQKSLTPPSPTQGKEKGRGAPRPNIDPTVVGDAVVGVAGNHYLPSGSTSALRQSQEFQTCLSSPLRSPTPQAAPLARNCFSSPPRQDQQRCPRDRRRAAKQSCANKSRREYGITHSIRGAERRTSLTGDPIACEPGPQDSCHRASASGKAPAGFRLQPSANMESKPDAANNVTPGLNGSSAIAPNAQDVCPPNPFGSAPQSLAKETTKSSVTADLPSAQVPTLPALASLPSNLSSHSQMLREAVNHYNDEAIDAEHLKRAAAVDLPIAEGTDAAPEGWRILPTERQGPVLGVHQQSASLVTDHASIVSWSTKNDGRGKRKAASSGDNTAKRRLISMTEHIAPESTRSSIKSILKVAKPTVVIQDKITISKKAMLPGEEQQPDGNDGHGAATTGSESPKFSLASAPRSILKSSAQGLMKVPPSSNNHGSSSDKQDAQRQQLLKMVDDEDFDLDAAMDDLGSYLGTWDAEKEGAFSAAAHRHN